MNDINDVPRYMLNQIEHYKELEESTSRYRAESSSKWQKEKFPKPSKGSGRGKKK